MQHLPPIPKLANELSITQKVDFEVYAKGELFLFSYEFKIGINFSNPLKEISVECTEEQNIPSTWE